MRYCGCVVSHVGNVRERNEDNACLDGHYRKNVDLLSWKYECESSDSILAAVFDGLGGEMNGDVASKIAAEKLAFISGDDFTQKVYRYIEETNREIALYDIHNYMGTTFAAFYTKDEQYYFYNVGDSRVYMLRDGVLEQMTQDHNPVRRMQKEGILTKEQADRHPQRNALSRFLGLKDQGMVINPECYAVEGISAKQGDRILLCTDGLSELVSDEDMAHILSYGNSNNETVEMLLNAALDAGGKDNITVVLIDVN
ncbi:MAG: serine/threonine-protein phosphatase [Lachnospiraceae bacterium]|nr:serine/threonine-protein phosphatase [Lachnospiraceae bacterium]